MVQFPDFECFFLFLLSSLQKAAHECLMNATTRHYLINSLVNHSWINNKQSSNYTVVIEYTLLFPVTEYVMSNEII